MTSDKAAVIKRYSPGFIDDGESRYLGMKEYTGGGYVSHTDHAAALQAARDEVERLQVSLDQLTGMKFSDRMHAALIFRAENAERRVAELVDAGMKLRPAMDMQEKRETGEFHINQPTATNVWNEAKSAWDSKAALAPAKKVD